MDWCGEDPTASTVWPTRVCDDTPVALRSKKASCKTVDIGSQGVRRTVLCFWDLKRVPYGKVLILIISSKVGRNVGFKERGRVDASWAVGIDLNLEGSQSRTLSVCAKDESLLILLHQPRFALELPPSTLKHLYSQQIQCWSRFKDVVQHSRYLWYQSRTPVSARYALLGFTPILNPIICNCFENHYTLTPGYNSNINFTPILTCIRNLPWITSS